MPGAEGAARRVLRAAVASGGWARPFLLLGPPGEERDGGAEAFARAVLCSGRAAGEGEACGACGPCHRAARDLHPDLHRLLPGKGRASVGVDAVEALRGRLALRPVEGRGRAVLVPDAERLTDQAQNGLLKTLEEPPPSTALVLTAAAPRALLPTIRSRCAPVRFPPAAEGVLARRAREAGAAESAAALIAAAAGGDPLRVGAALEEGLAEAAAPLAAAFAPRRGGGDPLAGMEPAAAWVRGGGGRLEEQRERLRMALRVLLHLHRPGGAAALPEEGRRGYDGLPPTARRARLAALGEARERVERNVDPGGILEALAVAVRAADAGGGN